MTSSPSSNANSIHTAQSPHRPPHRNITPILLYTFLSWCSTSLWGTSVLTTFIYLLRHESSVSVGSVTAFMGLSQLISSLPSGLWADHYGRVNVLRAASLLGLPAALLTLWASYRENFPVLMVGLSLWGLHTGMTVTAVTALFADSIQEGQRSKYFTKRMMLTKGGMAVGPLVSLVLFHILGNEWRVSDCGAIMVVGQIVSMPCLGLLWYMRDVVDEDRLESDNDSTCRSLSEPLLSDEHPSQPHSNAPLFYSKNRIIPILVCTADILAGLAAGMSIRYIPIFLLDLLHLSPVQVQLYYFLSPMGQVPLSQLAQYGGRKWGRCQIVCFFKWTGICFMMLTICSYQWACLRWITCLCLIVRTCFMNSTQALTKSVLMDHVVKEERAKWSALESVNSFGWSGSAALGGWLVQRKGIVFNFYVTMGLQVLATVPLVGLWRMIQE